MKLLKKLLPALIFGLILGLVIYLIEPPKSLSQASPLQFGLFFIPLILLLTFLLNLYFRLWSKSLVAGVGVAILFFLQGGDSLNLLTGGLVFTITILVLKFIKRKNHLYQPKISKLSRLYKQK